MRRFLHLLLRLFFNFGTFFALFAPTGVLLLLAVEQTPAAKLLCPLHFAKHGLGKLRPPAHTGFISAL